MLSERIKDYCKTCIMIIIMMEMTLVAGVVVAMVASTLFSWGFEEIIFNIFIGMGVLIPTLGVISMILALAYSLAVHKEV